ncbi:hypothetical protein JCM19233_365 [Vibrio astriarenae]|nr:hypothetical protein JCM19233_365 [Vibrio sp. C7]
MTNIHDSLTFNGNPVKRTHIMAKRLALHVTLIAPTAIT